MNDSYLMLYNILNSSHYQKHNDINLLKAFNYPDNIICYEKYAISITISPDIFSFNFSLGKFTIEELTNKYEFRTINVSFKDLINLLIKKQKLDIEKMLFILV